MLLSINTSERLCVELSADRSSVHESMAWFFNRVVARDVIIVCCDHLGDRDL